MSFRVLFIYPPASKDDPAALAAARADVDRQFMPYGVMTMAAGLRDAGKVMVLSNNFPGPRSTLELLDLPVAADGSFDMSRTAVATPVYDKFHTRNMGGGMRLPNGNTLVFESVYGRILEVTAAKEVVWEYIVPHDEGSLGETYRCLRYPGEYVEGLFERI